MSPDKCAEKGDSGLAVSSRVRVALPGGVTVTGVIVEDFIDLMGAEPAAVRVDATRCVQLRRWGIAVDDGTLVFADDDQIELDDLEGEVVADADHGVGAD